MKVLVTGASGFVGGAVFRACRERGWEVRGVGRRSVADPDYRLVDLASSPVIDFQPDVVVHAAALSSPWGASREFLRQNVGATENVRRFCEGAGAPHLIYISSAAVFYRYEHQYGMNEETPIPVHAVNDYARTKFMGEQVVRGYIGNWCILRPRGVFGPGDTVVFPRVLRAAQAGRLPIIETDSPVMGDLIYIDTLVDYIAAAVQHRVTGDYNLTNDRPIPFMPFLQRIFTELGFPPIRKRLSADSLMRAARVAETFYKLLPFLGEPPITAFAVSAFAYSKTFNVSKAIRDLGRPSVAFEDGVSRFLAWEHARLKSC